MSGRGRGPGQVSLASECAAPPGGLVGGLPAVPGLHHHGLKWNRSLGNENLTTCSWGLCNAQKSKGVTG